MGFQKGSITLSPAQDIPLLVQVLHSRFITHDQLFEFMLLGCYELKRPSFNWRVRRLVESGLLTRHCARPVTPSPVYSITPLGALMLADHCPVLENPKDKTAVAPVHLAHSIELNALHLSLARQGVLEDWQSEVTIRAENELTASGYVKDYDAIVTVRIDGQPSPFRAGVRTDGQKIEETICGFAPCSNRRIDFAASCTSSRNPNWRLSFSTALPEQQFPFLSAWRPVRPVVHGHERRGGQFRADQADLRLSYDFAHEFAASSPRLSPCPTKWFHLSCLRSD